MTDDEIPAKLLAPRPAIINPRRTGYKHKPIIVIHDDLTGELEDGTQVRNIPAFLASMESSIWITRDPAYLLSELDRYFGSSSHWSYEFSESEHKQFSRARLIRFGLRSSYYQELGIRKRSLHICWIPQYMMPDYQVDDLMAFALDIRDWLQENDLPIVGSPSGIGGALLRDKRFYANARARVPTATNERLRPYLPGIHQELRCKTNRRFDAIALDQSSAYHRIVQEIELPDASTLYAYGHFNNPDEAKVWLKPVDKAFEKVLSSPGLVCISALSRLTKPGEFRPPAVNFTGEKRIFLWTNEIAFLRQYDVTITGIYAAWISESIDQGLSNYGKWAMKQIQSSSLYRKQWLKPTLHSTYGLLGAKPRTMRIGRRIGKGEPMKWMFRMQQFFVRVSTFQHKPATANVAQLGMIQAEVRLRTMKMANALQDNGATVTHIHADGLHVTGNMPLLNEEAWRTEERTGLVYLDKVSWRSDQGDVLPGRAKALR